MSRILRTTILRVLDGDDDLYHQLCVQGLLPEDEDALAGHHVELARVTQTLVRELEVNWAGVEIVLRLRSELIESRRQVAALLRLMEAQQKP